MIIVKDIWLYILKNVARYEYLTATQLEGFGNYTINYLYSNIKKLREAELIRSAQYGINAVKSEQIHYLTRKGVKQLLEWSEEEKSKLKPEDIRYPKSKSIVGSGISHRINFINLHISYDRWR